MECCGDAAAADIGPACEPDDDSEPERVTVDEGDNAAQRSHIVTYYPFQRRIPADASLHGNEYACDRQYCSDAGPSAVPGDRHDGELGGDDMRITEIRDGTPLHLRQIAGRIGRDGFPQVVGNFLPHADRHGAIEIELAREPIDIVGN